MQERKKPKTRARAKKGQPVELKDEELDPARGGRTSAQVYQHNQTDLEFLKAGAKRTGYE
jgi:hypothetical protein